MLEKQLNIYFSRAENFIPRLKKQFFSEKRDFRIEVFVTGDHLDFREFSGLDFRPASVGDKWGEIWQSGYFRLSGQVPKEWRGKDVRADLNLGGEILIFDRKGVPEYGLTFDSVFDADYMKTVCPLASRIGGNGKIELLAECGANALAGKRPGLGTIYEASYGVFEPEVWEFYLDFDVLFSMLKSLRKDSARYRCLLLKLNEAIGVYDEKFSNAAAARKVLAGELKNPALRSALVTTAVGHAHIDTGWLWPVRESIRKAARTFSSQIANIKNFPGYVFGASQPQLYAFVKARYPGLYEKIREAVRSGSWELQGGMWVEADCNIISGESMIRQFVHGKNFFMDEFGIEVKNLWLPDVFGYSAAMPQIIRKSGCDYFLTQKISWSQVNKFAYHSFVWRGLGGYEVLTHFPPEDTYNSMLNADSVVRGADNYAEAHINGEYLTVFGIGDGGGGPSELHLGRAERLKNLENAPKLRYGRADGFFARLEKFQDKLPRFSGELYLELHRGTLTTQGRTKRNNRKCEELLNTLEFTASLLPARDYPKKELDRMWKTLLINQFHDIIPGSSIREVYEVTEKEHAELIREASSLIARLGGKLVSAKSNDTVVLLNTAGFAWRGAAELPEEWADFEVLANGRAVPSQSGDDGVFAALEIPPRSVTVLRRGAERPAKAEEFEGAVLENDLVRYVFDRNGVLLSCFDKETERECIGVDGGNRLRLYPDDPNRYDAWDIDRFYLEGKVETAKCVRFGKIVAGEAKQTLELDFTVGVSRISQEISLAANSKRLDFRTFADWHESHRMLRVNFATSTRAETARCDIQYGFIDRTTGCNDSIDWARFEVAAHRYVSLRDADGGAALLNDCKYGYHLSESELDLNLLRSPKTPDAEADMGGHLFTYSFLPLGGGNWEEELQIEASSLNRLPVPLRGEPKKSFAVPFAAFFNDGVSFAVMKREEKGDGLVLRLAEYRGKNSRIGLCVPKGKVLAECDLLEWREGKTYRPEGGKLELDFKPFEIRTFLVK